jgi:hypothetical protein
VGCPFLEELQSFGPRPLASLANYRAIFSKDKDLTMVSGHPVTGHRSWDTEAHRDMDIVIIEGKVLYRSGANIRSSWKQTKAKDVLEAFEVSCRFAKQELSRRVSGTPAVCYLSLKGTSACGGLLGWTACCGLEQSKYARR